MRDQSPIGIDGCGFSKCPFYARSGVGVMNAGFSTRFCMTRLAEFRTVLRLWLALVSAFAIAGCAQYATVSEKRPKFASAAATPVVCQECITNGMQQERRQPLAALGEYLSAADAAADQLNRNPRDRAALDAYNFAISRAFATIKEGELNPWTQPLRVPSRNGEYILTNKKDTREGWSPELYTLTPADQFNVGGLYVAERTTKAGLGAPLLSVGREARRDARENFVSERTYYGVTAVARFEPGNRCVIAFEDPLGKETTTMGGRTYPLAADFTVPMAVMLAKENPKKLELARLLRPGKYAETAHIVRLEPYNPEKTVVLVVHGLMDSPATWTAMINHLRGDPVIRRNFQFWYYSYPSGYPYPYSAAIMRRELDAIEKRFPLRKPMVLVGHSMGSLISRLMITDTGLTIWMKLFGKPPERMTLAADTRRMLEDSLIFRTRREVGRAIFLCGPHRGSELAGHWIGRLGAMLVKAPSTLMKVAKDMKNLIQADPSALRVNHIPNSVDTLAPNNRFVKAINTIPITRGIPYHSIIGDRGRGDTPKSSDGVVPYWSSHLDGAQSELIVPSNHSAQRNPQAIAEVDRILRLHAGQISKP
jgi:pimeloyl-ACP methyl ester carboxylesterase